MTSDERHDLQAALARYTSADLAREICRRLDDVIGRFDADRDYPARDAAVKARRLASKVWQGRGVGGPMAAPLTRAEQAEEAGRRG